MNYALGIELQPILVFVTVAVVFTYVVSHTVNKEKLANWIASISLGDKQLIKNLAELSKERRHIELERNKLSAQDHYAKWTRLNRKLTKLDDEITELSQSISSHQSIHINTISKVLTIIQKAPMYIIRFWYARTPVIIFLQNTPHSVNVPFPLSYILRMPIGQKNTVSVFFWCMAIESILSMMHVFVADCYKYMFMQTPVTPEVSATG